jgi:hypothetical protein
LGSSRDKLTPLQNELLDAFFGRERGFFLTGGAALAGFHLHHRETSDLDFFTTEADAFERGRHALRSAAADVGAELVVRQDVAGFCRFVATRGNEGVVVDLVWERVAQVRGEKLDLGGIRVDPVEEILANKLCTVLSRSEERDLVDLFCLERAGFRIESALADALRKDGGCTPAALAYVLGQIRIPDTASVPGGVRAAELRSWVEDAVTRLLRAAAPPSS